MGLIVGVWETAPLTVKIGALAGTLMGLIVGGWRHILPSFFTMRKTPIISTTYFNTT
jgi:hypothetical protein